MTLIGDDELHPKSLTTFVFNLEVSLHMCSFCHGFGHLLANCPYKSNQVEVQPVLLDALPLVNPPIAPVFSYPNTVPRNSNSYGYRRR
jgi:hypothetical protein